MVLSYILGQTVKVVSDDSDVFAVLVHFYSTMKCVTLVNMISPIHDRGVIDIRATRIKHSVIADDIFGYLCHFRGEHCVILPWNWKRKSGIRYFTLISWNP